MTRSALTSALLTCMGLTLVSCGSSPDPRNYPSSSHQYRPVHVEMDISLPDRTIFNQKDKRWGHHELGQSGDSLAKAGCVVTSAAMALSNLGVKTNPSSLNAWLTKNEGYTSQGWLIWNALEKASGGRAEARFYSDVSDEIIEGCLADGYYPLTRFYLPNGRSHWAMVVGRSDQGFHMRDPLRVSNSPLIFPRGTDAFKAVRCIGPKRA